MATFLVAVALTAALLAGLAGCDAFGPSSPVSRSYVMGFTPFPHANSTGAVAEAWDVISRDADLAAIHLDGGLPWQEALDGTPYPQSFSAELAFHRDRVPIGHTVYLAVTPISQGRDGLAGYRNDLGPNQPLPPPWNTYEFDSPPVIDAFTAYCEDLIELFDPDYFAYAIEANMLRRLAPGEWSDFVYLAGEVYSAVKFNHPSLPVFVTVNAESYYVDSVDQEIAIGQLMDYSDMMALSTYPFAWPLSDPADLELDYFSTIHDIAPWLPFAIAETAWPAEDVDLPYPTFIPASPAEQALYVERLMEECERKNARFLCWFFTRDFDLLWETDLQFDQDADLIRLWRDTGLIDGDGFEREAMGVWRQALIAGT
jgi:hypothetical protein